MSASLELEKRYHRSRRMFVVLPGVGIIFGEPQSPLSHKELVEAMGIPAPAADALLASAPRGYVKNGEVGIYKGAWEPLDAEDAAKVAVYWPDISRVFGLGADAKIFNGFAVGAPGTPWKPKQTTTAAEFFRQTAD